MIWPFSWFTKSPQNIGVEYKQSLVAPAISAWSVGNPVARERDYGYYSKEGFSENPIVNACISMTAQAIATLPISLKDGSKDDKKIDEHDVLKLLNSPNPDGSKTTLIEEIVSHYMINGNSYIESVSPSQNKPPKELWILRSDRVKVVPDSTGAVTQYEYTVNGLKKRFDRNKINGKSDLLHIKSFSPIEDFYGQSMLTPCAYEIDMFNDATKHMMALLQNGASPSGALIFHPIKNSNGDAISPPPEIIEKAEKSLTDRHVGVKNSGKPMVLNGNVDWKAFGFSPRDLGVDATRESAARFICSTLDVPYQLVVKGESTYNNLREAKLAFYTEAVLPLGEKIYTALGEWLLPRFGLENARFEIDRDQIEALSPLREAKQQNTQELYDKNIIGRDEARDSLQWEAEPEVPQRKIDASILTALSSIEEGESAPKIVIYNYLKSVGLVPKDMDFAQYQKEISDIDVDDEGDEEESEGDENDEIEPETEDEVESDET